MKILKNNFEKIETYKSNVRIKPYPRTLICENCESELEYEEEDLVEGVFGAMYIECPLCGYSNMLDGNEHDVTLTKDNVNFPVHFYHISKENGAVEISSDRVKEWIKYCINHLRNDKDSADSAGYCYTGSGDTMVYAFKLDGDEEYEVVVTKDYYSTYIPFENEDY